MIARSSKLLGSAVAVMVSASAFAVGDTVPKLVLKDLQGVDRTFANFPGRVKVVLFWQPEKENASRMLCAVAGLDGAYERGALVTIVPGQQEKADIERVVGSCKNRPAVLLDPERTAFHDFEIVAFPTLLLVDSENRIRFKLAGFGLPGMGEIQKQLDTLYGRNKSTVNAPGGAPEALHKYRLAQQLLKIGVTAKADAILTDLTAAHPEFRPAWVALGYRYVSEQREEDALRCFQKAVELDHSEMDVAAGLAWAWSKKGDAAQSAKWRQAVGAGDPNASLIGLVNK